MCSAQKGVMPMSINLFVSIGLHRTAKEVEQGIQIIKYVD